MEYILYAIEDLFYKAKTNKLNYKVKDLPKIATGKFNLPALTAGIENQGLSCYVPDYNATKLSNCISVSANGANTGAMFYQPNTFTVLQDSYVLLPINKSMTKNSMLYLICCMQYVIKGNYDWSNKAGWERIKKLKIYVPTLDGINPDYEKMDSLISELEQERISELDKYLKVTELNDYKLSDEDKNVLNRKINLTNFKVSKLFDIHPTKTYKGNNDYLLSKNGKIPVVANTSSNNGIGGYSNLNPTENGGIITFSDTTTADSIFYQPNDFVGYSHVQGMYPYSDLWNEKSLRYFMTVFKKVALNKNFDYANKFNRKLALDFDIPLPSKDGINPEYEYMEKYITAIEKLTIKNVVEYKDKIIEKTKQVCSE